MQLATLNHMRVEHRRRRLIVTLHCQLAFGSVMQKPGQQLRQKLCHYLQPKCHPLILDITINSASTVRLNIYQVKAIAC